MRDVSRSAKVFVKSERAKKSEKPRIEKSESTNTTSDDVRCYNCGSRGHYASDCESKSRGPKCFVCSDFGHRARECPKKEVRERKEDSELHAVAETNMPVEEMKVGASLLRTLFDTGSRYNVLCVSAHMKIGEPPMNAAPMTFRGFGAAVTRACVSTTRSTQR